MLTKLPQSDILTFRHEYKNLKNIDVEQVAAALEADTGELLPDIRQALEEAKRGEYARKTSFTSQADGTVLREVFDASGKRIAHDALALSTPSPKSLHHKHSSKVSKKLEMPK